MTIDFIDHLKERIRNHCNQYHSAVSISLYLVYPLLSSTINLSHHLAFVHYYVQSLASKLDMLHAEPVEFDIVVFTENWLSSSVATDDPIFESFSKPERKDHHGDAHGGVIIYAKEYLHYRRRRDLESRGVECL